MTQAKLLDIPLITWETLLQLYRRTDKRNLCHFLLTMTPLEWLKELIIQGEVIGITGPGFGESITHWNNNLVPTSRDTSFGSESCLISLKLHSLISRVR